MWGTSVVHVCSLECVLLWRICCSVMGSCVLHCEVMQLPCYIGCSVRLVCVCVCVVGKMAEDIGMTIRKSIVVSFLSCLVAFWHSIPIA